MLKTVLEYTAWANLRRARIKKLLALHGHFHFPDFRVTSEEIDIDTVRVVLIIPGLEVEKKFLGSAHPKKGTVVDVQFGDSTLEVKADVKDKKGQIIKYEFKVRQLPGLINKDKCKTEYKKEQIILTLVKNEDFRNSWAVVLSKNGLEQAADD